MALTESNHVVVWGHLSDPVNGRLQEVDLLSATPISQIYAGGNHFAVLTLGGRLLCWGSNEFGQICVDSNKIKFVSNPTGCFTNIGTDTICDVSCGTNHTAVCTTAGRVLAAGANSFGQLGTGKRFPAEFVPQSISDLLGTRVSQVACGRCHTLALTEHGHVYSFGLNSSGQAGVPTAPNYVISPKRLDIPAAVSKIVASWDQSVAICDRRNEKIERPRHPRSIQYQEFKAIHEKAIETGDKMDVIGLIESVFSAIGCINASFVRRNRRSCYGHDLKMDDVMAFFNLIAESSDAAQFHDIIIESLKMTSFSDVYLSLFNTERNSFTIEQLRFFIILPWFQPMVNPTNTAFVKDVLTPFVNILEKALHFARKTLTAWWSLLETRHFNRIVQCLTSHIQRLFERNSTDHSAFIPGLSILQVLCEINKVVNRVPYDKFYLHCLNRKVDIQKDYVEWYIANSKTEFFWSNYPFLMNAEVKSAILETDSQLRMRIAITESHGQINVLRMMHGFPPQDPFLTYKIRRDHIVQDTYQYLQSTIANNPVDINRPLRIEFEGEEAEDRGGVRKEFFMLLFNELLQNTYGMFIEDEESHYVWFSGVAGDSDSYKMVGLLVGLAIYNGVQVNLPFPVALYKYLLEQPITLDDFCQLHPSEGRSLETLMEYENDDIEEVFDLDFTCSVTVFGHVETVELKQDGTNIKVNKNNRAEFVQLYIDMKMTKGLNGEIGIQMKSFGIGLKHVLNPSILRLFQPCELMEMVIGNENYDWEAFRRLTQYKGDYYANHEVILTFWKVFGELSEEQKKKFLLFLMGTDRVPLRGMSEIVMTIQPQDESRFPVAHTCFNLLDLPKITDVNEMRRRLLISLEHSEGFSLA
ncbi:HECT-domain (ubiquitin-transferase) domain-containing protein [Ditylenchus destructor]|uniref:HECT-domain (Ubiquitin-transferase) domain-containing protein n=1 Tax=Ditylenchus destructor TaxID=166010 RepID=A0AAD4N360_9BILA|nr:HECT-domain (ubiquitin-transferase) domain-containing protein [Ditylenchus destructor]